MDPSEWEQVGSVRDAESNGVMRQLERFVWFMVHCSVGEDLHVPWHKLPRPPWWPRRLLFRIHTGATPTPSTRSLLQRLVERCYQYHGCEFLLQFCRSLVQHRPATGYRFTDNRDGTTAMHHTDTGKLLVTFRNENREYEKLMAGNSSPVKPLSVNPVTNRPQLLPRRGSGGAMVRGEVQDVFLCDRCDQEYTCLADVQVARLHALGLTPAPHTGRAPHSSPTKVSGGKGVRGAVWGAPPPHVRKVARSSAFRCDSVDFSSPLGRNRGLARWVTVYRSPKLPWTHSYSFNKAQRCDRWLTIETGLDARARTLLHQLRPPKVVLKRVPKRVIDRYSRLGGHQRPAMYIDLTGDEGAFMNQFIGGGSSLGLGGGSNHDPGETNRVVSGTVMPYGASGMMPASRTLSGSSIPFSQVMQIVTGNCNWAIAPGFMEHVIAGGQVPDNVIALTLQKLFSPTGRLVQLLKEAINNNNFRSKAEEEYGTSQPTPQQQNALLIKYGILQQVAYNIGVSDLMMNLVLNHGKVLSNASEMIRLTSLPPSIPRVTHPEVSSVLANGGAGRTVLQRHQLQLLREHQRQSLLLQRSSSSPGTPPQHFKPARPLGSTQSLVQSSQVRPETSRDDQSLASKSKSFPPTGLVGPRPVLRTPFVHRPGPKSRRKYRFPLSWNKTLPANTSRQVDIPSDNNDIQVLPSSSSSTSLLPMHQLPQFAALHQLTPKVFSDEGLNARLQQVIKQNLQQNTSVFSNIQNLQQNQTVSSNPAGGSTVSFNPAGSSTVGLPDPIHHDNGMSIIDVIDLSSDDEVECKSRKRIKDPLSIEHPSVHDSSKFGSELTTSRNSLSDNRLLTTNNSGDVIRNNSVPFNPRLPLNAPSNNTHLNKEVASKNERSHWSQSPANLSKGDHVSRSSGPATAARVTNGERPTKGAVSSSISYHINASSSVTTNKPDISSRKPTRGSY
ncbi:uncharacterized protein LOC108671500, partial [Hyalella azteca]|uniref:Uncharacterized protein LOC108671500 n=1 Tax=Hyalella azteca TaxID=294128 RepID=A0A8B7NLJ9_HYAAZ